MQFKDLGLADELLRAVADQGYTEPTPIQAKAIPPVLLGQDVMGAAQTGTGKTAGFTLPLLQRLRGYGNASMSPARHPVRALILTPTRELAAQVHESVQAYSKYLLLRNTVVYGGVDIAPQTRDLRAGVEILVATPGRLLDHVQQKTVQLNLVEILVLDEADRMLDMGFMPDIRRILSLLPKTRQSLLFSATFSEEIRKLADGMLNQPVLVEVARRNAVTETVSHAVYKVPEPAKRDLLHKLIVDQDMKQVLVFVRTRFGANRLAHQLVRDGLNATAIHSNRTQAERTEALQDFKAGKVNVLVATDIAARGLDIEQLPCVINYELPHTPEDYVHRIGRTGRAGQTGQAISLVCSAEGELLERIEKLLKTPIEVHTLAGFDPQAESRRDDRPSRGPRGGQSSRPSRRHAETGSGGTPPRSGRSAEQQGKQDPLFGKPYEPAPRASSTTTASRNNTQPTVRGQAARPVPALLKPRPDSSSPSRS
ncbi:MAG: DEAD/DEAH box helicase [Betaproteobacteria bacterium]|nr:DEAD/DEAH box helicase [Betaproteobacteria bacterium]